MATSLNGSDGTVDAFMERNGHDLQEWAQDGAKRRCPECGGVNEPDAADCSVCGWYPGR